MELKENIVGYFSFSEIIEDGEIALNSKLYRISLMLALIIPSICSRIEFANNPSYRDQDGRWRDRDCYVDWCLLQNIKFIDAENKAKDINVGLVNKEYYHHIYEIRCGAVHDSTLKCDDVSCNICVNANDDICKIAHCDMANKRDICLIHFCKQMFNVGKKYYENHKEEFEELKIPIKTFINKF